LLLCHALAQPADLRCWRPGPGGLHVVGRFHPGAALYAPPPAYSGHGRPRVKGAKLPTPREVVATAERTRLNVA
jgi:hypothetical protein